MGDATLRLLMSLTAFGSVVLIAAGLVGLGQGRLAQALSRRREQDARSLDDLFLHDVSPLELWLWIAVSCVAAGVIGYLLTDSTLFGVLAALAVPLLPRPLFGWMWSKRIAQFEEQLPSVLNQLAASARSTLSLPQCIEEIARHGNPPASQEFALMLKDMRMGAGPRDAIQTARRRLGSRSFDLVASALSVSLEKGGNLPEALEQIGRSLKELWRLDQKLLTASAEGRKAVRMITAMPVVLFFLISATQPELIDTLVGNPVGWVVLIIAGVLYGGGVVWVRRILAVNV